MAHNLSFIHSEIKIIMNKELMLSLILTLIVGWTSGQKQKSYPFWVVEGNIRTPYYTIVRFYSSDGLLLKQERVEGFFIDINKKKNRRFLDKRLAQVVRSQDQWSNAKRDTKVESY